MRVHITILLILCATSAWADLVFTLTPSARAGAKSNEVVFIGTLRNTSLTDNLFLNDVGLSFTGASTNYLVADTNTFFASVPGILSPGETYGDAVFGILINPTTPPGDYFGSVTIQGGSNIFATADLTNQAFQVSVVIYEVPFSAWQQAQFGDDATNSAISGDLADPDGDGIANLLEYALYLNPHVASVTGLPTAQSDSVCGCLTLTYTKSISATDLVYTAEAASNPGGAWSTNGITRTVIADDAVTQTIRASDAASPTVSATNRFMHLRITRQP